MNRQTRSPQYTAPAHTAPVTLAIHSQPPTHPGRRTFALEIPIERENYMRLLFVALTVLLAAVASFGQQACTLDGFERAQGSSGEGNEVPSCAVVAEYCVWWLCVACLSPLSRRAPVCCRVLRACTCSVHALAGVQQPIAVERQRSASRAQYNAAHTATDRLHHQQQPQQQHHHTVTPNSHANAPKKPSICLHNHN